MVSKEDRKFHVGLALEFEEFVIAFLSNDMVFQPTWATTNEGLSAAKEPRLGPKQLKKTIPAKKKVPAFTGDIIDDYPVFLQGVVSWLSLRAHLVRGGLATTAIRDSNEVWTGIGVYTVNELFFMAGLSPFLSEAEVFDSPSRTACLCEAFWTYAHPSKNDLPGLLKPAIVKGILAPTQKQCLVYGDWLRVYAKARVRVTARQAFLIDDYKNRLEKLEQLPEPWYRNQVPLHDIFEPEEIQAALQRTGTTEHPNPTVVCLGPLIFGAQSWVELCNNGVAGCNLLGSDPLTLYFTSKYKDEPKPLTFLRSGYYMSLFPSDDMELRKRPYRLTYTYQSVKVLWSVTKKFPENSSATQLSKVSKASIEEIVGVKRDGMFFRNIVSSGTSGVAIGPLEYCAVRKDPSLPAYLMVHEALGLERAKEKLDKPGQAKRAMSSAQRRRNEKLRERIIQQNWSSSPLTVLPPQSSSPPHHSSLTRSSSPTPLAPPPKRRRLCQDKQLANPTGKENIIQQERVLRCGQRDPLP
ncbi:hypothetical protein DXG01_000728 [Tephrocybe rancida]|nr:hypothetical protein DXG01_000728 [Tephrocybe rancida]